LSETPPGFAENDHRPYEQVSVHPAAILTPREFATDIARKLQQAGFQALWAGGCVRDQLLGQPPKDYDVATDATPDQIRQLFGRRRTLALGAAFGVITVLGSRSAGNIEVATFRRDADYSDGRHPDSVEFSTAEMDAQRRDFTINGLFFDPIKNQIIDYVGGHRDLQQRIIRAIGDPAHRIAEDKLRMLRAVRFAANLEFALDPATAETIRRHASEIHVVSAERISAELQSMLVHSQRRRAVQLLIETGLLREILPELADLLQDEQRLAQRLARLDRLQTSSLAVALATLLDDVVGPDRFAAVCQRLKLSNAIRDCGRWIFTHKAMLRRAPALPWSSVQPLLTSKWAASAIEFLQAAGDCPQAVGFCRERLAWSDERLDPPPLIDGNSLREHGFQPGPWFRQVLQEVRRAQLDGEVSSTDEALALARRMVDGGV
jgi:tRNA nucleotidyltransferase/poly(A) polymerase